MAELLGLLKPCVDVGCEGGIVVFDSAEKSPSMSAANQVSKTTLLSSILAMYRSVSPALRPPLG
jgi:hypothetical protein